MKAFRFSQLLRYWHPVELTILCLVIGATGLIAWFSPPTTYDSMTYQLPRAMHWLQQGSLEHYPTSNVRQLAYGPGATYWQVQLWSLFDGDLAANIPQWIALIGCALALTLWIQRFFGLHAIGLATITALTLPMALLQASSTQTDLQVGCWLLIAAVFLSDRSRPSLATAGFAGLAIGLAVVTKPSAALYAAPLALVAFWQMARINGFGAGLKASMLWITISLMVCAPHFSRNYRWFGKPLGDDYGTVVESITPGLAASNGVRWLALNIPSMSAWRGIGQALEQIGINPNDRAVTFRDSNFSPPSPYVVYRLLLPDEDFAAYTISFALIILLTCAVRGQSVAAPKNPRTKFHSPWFIAILAMLFLHILFLKWQFWGNRLLLPCALFVCPVLVAMTGAWRYRSLRGTAGILMLLQTIFVLAFSLNRPLVPLPASWRYTGAVPLFSASRSERFYTGYNAEARPACQQLVSLVREHNWHSIGLVVDDNYPEYVLWRAMHDAGFDNVEFHHINAELPPNYHGAPWPPKVDGYLKVPGLAKP